MSGSSRGVIYPDPTPSPLMAALAKLGRAVPSAVAGGSPRPAVLIQSGFSPSAHALQGREALKLALWQFSPPIPFSSLGSPVSRLYSRYSPRAAGPGGSDNFTPGALNYSSPANRLARLLFFPAVVAGLSAPLCPAGEHSGTGVIVVRLKTQRRHGVLPAALLGLPGDPLRGLAISCEGLIPCRGLHWH